MHVNMIEMKVSIDVMLMDFIKEFDRLTIKLVHSFATGLLYWYIFRPSCLLEGRRAIIIPGQMDETCFADVNMHVYYSHIHYMH